MSYWTQDYWTGDYYTSDYYTSEAALGSGGGGLVVELPPKRHELPEVRITEIRETSGLNLMDIAMMVLILDDEL